MDLLVCMVLCVALVPNDVQCNGRGQQMLMDDMQRIMTAVYDPSWTPKPSDWDWRASWEREWMQEMQTIMAARKKLTPAHMRKFKYFSPDYYRTDMSPFNTAKFTEERTLSPKYPTYPTLPLGYSHSYLLFEDIIGHNPYNWSNETLDYANNMEKHEELYKKQQEELAGNKNKTVLKQLYKEWLKIDPLRKCIKERPKRQVTNNEDMETEERQLNDEYAQFHINVSEFIKNEGKKKISTNGVRIEEERHRRQVTNNDEMETEERQLNDEYAQFHINVSEFIKKEGKKKISTNGERIEEERHRRQVTNNDEMETEERQLNDEYAQFHVNVSEFIKNEGKKKISTNKVRIEEERHRRQVTNNDEMETEERQLNDEYAQFHINVSEFIKNEGKKKISTNGVRIEEERHRRQVTNNDEMETEERQLNDEYAQFHINVSEFIKNEGKKRSSTNGVVIKENRKRREINERLTEKRTRSKRTSRKKEKGHKRSTIIFKRQTTDRDVFDELGPLEDLPDEAVHWTNTLLDDLGSNWEGKTDSVRIDWKALRAEREKIPWPNLTNLSSKEVMEKYGLPLYATKDPPLNVTKVVDPEQYCEMYDILFPGRCRNLDNVTVAPMYTNASGDTAVPAHRTKTANPDQYADFYDFMFKDRFKKQFTFGKVQYEQRNMDPSTSPRPTQTINHDEFFKWYDEEFTHGNRQNLDQITPHPLFAMDDGTPCPANKTKIIDPLKFDEEYDLIFGHRKKYVDVTRNQVWDYLENMGARTTEPWWTFYDSHFGDIQERRRTGVRDTNDMIEKALNNPGGYSAPELNDKEREFGKILDKLLKKEPHKNMVHDKNNEKVFKNHTNKSRVKRNLRQVDVTLLQRSEQLKILKSKGASNGNSNVKGRPATSNHIESNQQKHPVYNGPKSYEQMKINFNLQNIFATRKPQRQRFRRDISTPMHVFDYLKWAKARRKRRFTTPKRPIRAMIFDTNDSYIIMKNYIERAHRGEISDFDYANEIYGEYIDRYLTAQFDEFRRMYTRYSTPIKRPTWTRRTGYTDSLGRNFTFDPNYTYTTPYAEIDVIEYISLCRANLRRTTTQPTPPDLQPFTGTASKRKFKMTEYLDEKWLVSFGLITTSNVTTESTTSMYMINWLKYKQKQKVHTTTSISSYLKNFLQSRNQTRMKAIKKTTRNKFEIVSKAVKTPYQNKERTTSLFYRNFILSQNKNHKSSSKKYKVANTHYTRNPETRYQLTATNREFTRTKISNSTLPKDAKYKVANTSHDTLNPELRYQFTTTTTEFTHSKISNSTLPKCTNTSNNYLPEFLYYTSKRVKNFINRYGSYAREHMEKGILRQRILFHHPGMDICFKEELKNFSSHIAKVDKRIKEEEKLNATKENALRSILKLIGKNVHTTTMRDNASYESSLSSFDDSYETNGIDRQKREIKDVPKTTNKKFKFKYPFYKRQTAQETKLNETNLTRTTSIFMKNFMARVNLTSPKRRRFKITLRTSIPCRLVNLTTNFFPWNYFIRNETIEWLMMHYNTGSDNYTFPPIYSYTEGPQNRTWSIELEEDAFFRLRRRFLGKTRRSLARTRAPLRKVQFDEYGAELDKHDIHVREQFHEWRNAPLQPGLPSAMLSVRSAELEEHVAFLSTMHYVKGYTERVTAMDNFFKDDDSYSDYVKYQVPKLRTRHAESDMDFENVVKHRLYKAKKLNQNRFHTKDSDYVIESVQSVMDDDRRKFTFTFPMGNRLTLYPKYNPYYYNRSVINTDLMVENLKSLTRHPGTMARWEQEYRKNMTERMLRYLKENPDKKMEDLSYGDFEDTEEAMSQIYYMGLSTMKEEDHPKHNFDYIRNDYTAIDHAIFHWSIYHKEENRLHTVPLKPGETPSTSYLDYYWKTSPTLDWQRYWKYPHTSTNATDKPTGPNRWENREFAKDLERKLEPDQRENILADLEALGVFMNETATITTAQTILWGKDEGLQNIYNIKTTSHKISSEHVTRREKVQEKTINLDDVIDSADIDKEIGGRKKRHLIETEETSGEDFVPITAKSIQWRIPDSVLGKIRGTTPVDDIHNTEIAFKYLQNCTDSEEFLKITLPNYMRDIYYRFTKYTTPTTPIIKWSMPKHVLNMIDKGTNSIQLEAEKHVPFSVFRRKLMHMINLKMKSYSIPFYRQRLDKTPFSLNTDEKDEIYYDTEEREILQHRATHNYRMATYVYPLFSNSCERIIKDMVEGYHNIYDPPAVKRIGMKNKTSSTMKPGDYDGEWVRLNPSDLLRFPQPTIYWPTINRNDVTYRPPWIKNSTRLKIPRRTTTEFDTESFASNDSLVRDDWVFTTQHWNDINNLNITAIQIFMDRPKGQSSEFNDYCRKKGLPLDENGMPPTDWYDSNVPSSAENFGNQVNEHNTIAPWTYEDERHTVEEYVKKKDMEKCIDRLIKNETINWAEEDMNETSTIVIKSRAYLSKWFSRERYYKYDAKYLQALKEMGAPRKVKQGYKDPEYKYIEKLYENNKNNKSNIFFSNIYKDGIPPGHPELRSEEEEINRPLSWEYNPNYTIDATNTDDPFHNPFPTDPQTTTDPYTLVDMSDMMRECYDTTDTTLSNIPLEFVDNMIAPQTNARKCQVDSNIFPATTTNAYTCEFVTDLMSSYELRKKNIPKDAIVAHPYGKPHPYYKKVIYDRLGGYIATTFVSVER